MLAEHPLLTTKHFIHSWRDVDPKRLSEEIKSVFNETNRQPDPFSFVVRDGELVDSATNTIVNFRRNSELEKTEGRVWDDLKKWANKSESGTSAWISPILEGVYPANKFIFYEIRYTDDMPPQKVLFSTTILFDTPKDHCLKIAQMINPLMANVKNPEFLRGQLLRIQKNFNIADILELIGKPEKDKQKTQSQETINYFVDQIKSGRDPELIVLEMQAKGVIGEYSISCPTRSISALQINSRILNFSQKENWIWKKGDCVVPAPECGRKDIMVGPCGVCEICQRKFDQQDLTAAA